MSWLDLSYRFKPALPRVKIKASRKKTRLGSSPPVGRRLRGWVTIVIVLVLGGAVAGVRGWLLSSTYFAVKNIEVANLQTFNEKEIIALAGLNLGENIFRVNPRIYRERLLKETNIQDAAVYRVFPGTLRVRILERQPRARFRYGRYYTIDGWGVVLQGVKEQGSENLPTISGPGLSVRDGRLHPPDEVDSCLALLRELDDQNLSLALEITEIRLARSGVIEVKAASGLEITMARDNIRPQLKHLQAILPHLDGVQARRASVDLRYYPNIPVAYRN